MSDQRIRARQPGHPHDKPTGPRDPDPRDRHHGRPRPIGDDNKTIGRIRPKPNPRTIQAATAVTQTRMEIPVAGKNAVAPFGYGRFRTGGMVCKAGVAGNYLVLLVVWCAGPVENIVTTKNSDGSPIHPAILQYHYEGDPWQTPNTLLMQTFAGWNNPLVTTIAGGQVGLCYTVFAIPRGVLSGAPSFVAEINGLRLYDPRDVAQSLEDSSTWTWSDNPTLAAAHFEHSPVFGRGRAVDWASVATSADANDDLVTAGDKRRTIGLCLSQPNHVDAWSDALAGYAGAIRSGAGEVARFVPDRPGSAVATLTDDDVVARQDGSLLVDLTIASAANAPTVVTVDFTNVSYGSTASLGVGWFPDSVTVYAPGVLEGSTEWRETVLNMPGLQRKSQALREATELLNKSLLCTLGGRLATDERGIRYDRGDLIDLTLSIGLSGKRVRVTGVTPVDAGRYDLSFTEYQAAAYSNDIATDGTPDTLLPNPADVPAIEGLAATEIQAMQNDGSVSTAFSIEFDAPDYVYQHRIEIRLIRVGVGRIWSTLCDADELPVLSSAIPAVGDYTIKARVLPYATGIVGAWTSVNVAALCERLPPDPPTGLVYEQLSPQAYRVTWDSALDAAIYDVRLAVSAVAAFEDAFPVGTTTGTNLVFTRDYPMPYVLVRAVDALGNVSTMDGVASLSTTHAFNPVMLSVTPLGNMQYRLTWRNAAGWASVDVYSGSAPWEQTGDTTVGDYHGSSAGTTIDITLAAVPAYIWVRVPSHGVEPVPTSSSWLVDNSPELFAPDSASVASTHYTKSGAAGSDTVSAFEVVDHDGVADQALVKVRTSGRLEVAGDLTIGGVNSLAVGFLRC